VDWNRQRCWEDLTVGQALPAIRFPLSVYRLVVEAGANRDFNSIHHNSDFARGTGAPDMYANVVFLQGMWERCVREFIGLGGVIRQVSGFRMGSFNTAGDVVTVEGSVARVWEDGGTGFAELRMCSRNRHGVSVGPGTVTVSLPKRRDL
jgi:acyl dehydratase